MSFDPSNALLKATSRAKSDVANKLVSMFLHALSREVSARFGKRVSDPVYRDHVIETFGSKCLYCRCELEVDRSAVEHLDGMNRTRAGLHVPGNVALACKRCNNEKRRDDQLQHLLLADSGWEAFLSHDGSRCDAACKSCRYWKIKFPDADFRMIELRNSRAAIVAFRSCYGAIISWSDHNRLQIRDKAEELYRACQDFASREISSLVSDIAVGMPKGSD